MLTTPPKTPLLTILRNLDTDARRDEFSMLAGTTTSYLYQLAGCHNRACRSSLALAISKASEVMNDRYGCGSIDVTTLATMCPMPSQRSLKRVTQRQLEKHIKK